MSQLLGKIYARLSAVLTPNSRLEFAPGHYYSAICSVPEALRYLDEHKAQVELPHIEPANLWALFDRLSVHFENIHLPEAANTGRRYYQQDMYGPGDAVLLAAFIREIRPRRIIEVGSGFSSACALDAAEDIGAHTHFTFIEPYPADRLDGLLRAADRANVVVHAKRVQDVPLSTFDSLEAGDLLFLDTTHVSKTGSDVNHELFFILPRLKPGVFIHFHDIFWNWEYPDDWVRKNRSWNEIYLLRAFLMHNQAYEIVMFNDLMHQSGREKLQIASPHLATSNRAGGGLYLRKC